MKTCRTVLIVLFLIGTYIGFENELDFNSPTLYIIENKVEKNFSETFFYIIKNNTIVALFLSFVGFLTGGLLSYMIMFYNGLIFGVLINVLLSLSIPLTIKLKLILFHVPLELLSFFLFAFIGLRGGYLLKAFYHGEENYLSHVPNIKVFYLPLALLLTAALIETIVIKTLC